MRWLCDYDVVLFKFGRLVKGEELLCKQINQVTQICAGKYYMKLTPLSDGHVFMKIFLVVYLFYTGAIKSTWIQCIIGTFAIFSPAFPINYVLLVQLAFNSLTSCCRLHIYVCGHIDDPPMLN